MGRNPMHLEILVEDQSGKKALEILVPMIIGNGPTFKIHSYKGIGRIPKNLSSHIDASKRILLDRLPKLLRGYGKTFANYPDNYPASVILICDLDNKCLKEFRQELYVILNKIHTRPQTRFCIAIEEGEAWFFGDISAIKKAYPKSRDVLLNGYICDSICGTWEALADAVFPGGSQALQKKGWQACGAEKSKWSEEISPHMDVENNSSASFCYFRDKIRELVGWEPD